jgi:hypothetical protein
LHPFEHRETPFYLHSLHAELFVGESVVGHQSVVEAEDIAEVVVDIDSHPLRQLLLHVEHLTPEHVPHLEYVVGRCVGLKLYGYFSHAAVRVALYSVYVGHGLQLAFYHLGDQLLHLESRGAGVGDHQHGLFYYERGVLLLAELVEREYASQQHYGEKEIYDLAIV